MKGKLFKQVKLSIKEMIDEVGQLISTNEWNGKKIEQPNASTPIANAQFKKSPNFFRFAQRDKNLGNANVLDTIINQETYNEIINGKRNVIYKEVNETTMPTYVDVRESADGLILNNPHLLAEDDIRLDAYAHGIFGFVPRHYDYLRLNVEGSEETLTTSIEGVCFMPESYHKGGVFRCNYSDPVFEDDWKAAKKKGKNALQDLLYDPEGPDTKWMIGVLIGKPIKK